MATSEKSFQAYFMKTVPHGYRTSLVNGSGFPDLIMFHGPNNYSLIELKMLLVGPSGNKKLKSLFKQSQGPWYYNYLSKGGDRLFVCFQLNKGYGLLKVTKAFVHALDHIKYQEMKEMDTYREFSTLKELIGTLGEESDIP